MKIELLIIAAFSCMMAIFTLLFLCLHIPNNPLLNNYRHCRRYLAAAYGVMLLSQLMDSTFEYTFPKQYFQLSSDLILISASFQTLFIPLAIISIVNAKCINVKHMCIECSFIIVLSITLLYCACIDAPNKTHDYLLYFFSAYYCIQLARATRLIVPESKWAKERMDNYFSGQEADYLKWIRMIGYISISCGFVALISILFPSETTIWVTTSYSTIIYPFQGIIFLNYIYKFQLVTPVVPIEPEAVPSNALSMAELEQALEWWTKEKKYLRWGITINDMASELGTNRTYISTYINTYCGMNFNSWINSLKVEEAKNLMTSQPGLSIVAISEMVGYNEQSSFSRNFTKIVGQSPLNWRKNNTKTTLH